MTEEPHGASDDLAEGDAADRVLEFLERVTEALEIDGDITVTEENDTIYGVVDDPDVALFIGRHGQTIEAVQHLAFKVAARGESPAPRVIIDAGGYRERREEALNRQADQAAETAVSSGKPVALDAMGPFERKVVHEYLKDRAGIETYSEGTDPHRHLVVAPLTS